MEVQMHQYSASSFKLQTCTHLFTSRSRCSDWFSPPHCKRIYERMKFCEHHWGLYRSRCEGWGRGWRVCMQNVQWGILSYKFYFHYSIRKKLRHTSVETEAEISSAVVQSSKKKPNMINCFLLFSAVGGLRNPRCRHMQRVSRSPNPSLAKSEGWSDLFVSLSWGLQVAIIWPRSLVDWMQKNGKS